jgi:hypothetical protein
MKHTPILVVLSVLFVVNAPIASSGSGNLTSAIGIKGGWNMGFLNGQDADLANTETSFRQNFRAGAFWEFLVAPIVSLQLEADYSREGQRYKGTGVISENRDIDLSYIEVPLLIKVYFPLDVPTHPFVYAGPQIAFKTSVNTNNIVSVGPFGLNTGSNLDEHAKSVVGGIAVGAGLRQDLEKIMLMLDVRLTQGVTKTFNDNTFNRVYNGTFSVSAGIGFKY